MPLFMEQATIEPSLYSCKSVLFVICDICPRMCMSVKEESPYFSIGRLLGKKDFFDEYIAGLRKKFEDKGLRTGIFKNRKMNGMMCLWPQKERDTLAGCSRKFDAIAVIGCPSAVFTVNDSIRTREIPVFPMMRVLGIANFKSRMEPPVTIKLDMPEGDFIINERSLFN